MQRRLQSRSASVNTVFLGEQAKGVTDAGSAAVRVSGMEVGGLFGSLLAGAHPMTLRCGLCASCGMPSKPPRTFHRSASRVPGAVFSELFPAAL